MMILKLITLIPPKIQKVLLYRKYRSLLIEFALAADIPSVLEPLLMPFKALSPSF